MDHYHVGIVVTDIEAASAKLSSLLGITWGPVMHLDAVEYRDEAGNDIVLPTTMRYSTGTPCLELILEVPGSVWVRNEASNLHHIGFWSDSLPDQSEAFGAAGCPVQLCGRAGDVNADVVRIPPGRRTRDPHGAGRRRHARRHAVPLRDPNRAD